MTSLEINLFLDMESFKDKTIRRLAMIGRHLPSLNKEDEKEPLRVCVTGAAGQIGYSLVFMIAQGRMFGPYQKVILQLLDLEPMETALGGVKMELDDGAFPLVHDVITTTSPEVAFKDIDVALLVGARPRGPGMERKDLLSANGKIFEAQGKVLNKVAKKTVKVLVVGNPANTNSLICSLNAPSIPKENFTALTRLDQNRAIGQVALELGVPVETVKNIIIWGNHSATQYPDISHGVISDYPEEGISDSISSSIDKEWYEKVYIPRIQKRGAAVIAARKLSSAASAANAACDHMHDWIIGTKPGEVVSMGVISDGNPYKIAAGINYSFPVTCKDGKWSIVKGYKIDEFSSKMMKATEKELLQEKEAALAK